MNDVRGDAAAEVAKLADKLGSLLKQDILPGEGLDDDPRALTEAASFLADIAIERQSATPIIAVESLTDRNGDRRTRIGIVNDDMPFLVDSVAGAVTAAGLQIHRLIHPILSVERDPNGRLLAIMPSDSPGARRESLIYMETDRADARGRSTLSSSIDATLQLVRAAVQDWERMQGKLRQDADQLHDQEGAALLRWLLDRHLTLLGYELRTRDGAASDTLGICAVHPGSVLAKPAVEAAIAWFEDGKPAPLIIKSNDVSRVHRSSLIDLFILPIRDGRDIVGLSVHAGLWTSTALSTTPDRVPVLRRALAGMMEKFDFSPSSHAGKALAHALTALPHDILISFSPNALEALTLTAMSQSDRPRPQIALARSALGRHLFAFVWLPRDDLSTARRVAVEKMLSEAAHAPVLSWSMTLEESGVAQLRFTLDMRDGGRMPDITMLNAALEAMVRGWIPAVEAALEKEGEESRAAALAHRYAAGFPLGYRNGAGPEEAAIDIMRLQHLGDELLRSVRLYRNSGEAQNRLRMKLYSRDTVALSDAVPVLENFGFRVIEELSTPVDNGRLGHIQKFVIDLPEGGRARALLARADVIEQSIATVLAGHAENDRFNELIVMGDMEPDAVVIFRALYRYLRQTGLTYSLATVVEALARNIGIARALIGAFQARLSPKANDKAAEAALSEIEAGLDAVSAIDEDRILRTIRSTILATLRTNFFAPAGKEALAFKFDSAQIPGLPAPVPWREIWVYSPRVEGIHLRAGPIARGGLRWSDRRDDFRTEILGLMKAQRVKNAVIVPTGAKGGFYPKHLPNPQVDRDGWAAEGQDAYRLFIRTLLSVTDNIVDGKVVHPDGVRVLDGTDPYFVVAADKGTATFSDTANGIAQEHDFWLGDAFASGGSHGYDHKAMGITARGAWISVRRHFAEMGTDVQSEPVRVVGCGDMSGDVFGNGMLLSKAIKLVAAFDHRHIFLDPEPDAAKSWEERNRLFALPRSSWDDYDRALISEGGGVFPRSQKSIPLSPQIRSALGIEAEQLEPAALISAILKAPADLLWFGGIGTYIKAAAQNHIEVGDPANDRIRVNAEELRVRVVGEGANLGVTQAGRIAFSLRGGRINTDFIDNSAGVDCSDNEVNIKIALNNEMREGRLSFEDRNAFLMEMTDAVADIVLEDNRLQALGLSIAEAGGARDLPSYVRAIELFEAADRLDRAVEGLAPNADLLRRAQDSQGMTRPELAVLLATAKLALQESIENSPLPKDESMRRELCDSFPKAMQERFADAIQHHRLREAIIATELANRIVNRMGIIHPIGLVEEEGCAVADMVSAYVIAERLLDVQSLWADIDAADMSEQGRIALFNHIAVALRGQIADIVRSLTPGTQPQDGVSLLEAGYKRLSDQLDALLPEEGARRATTIATYLTDAGAPADLAERAVRLTKMEGAAGLALLAGRIGIDEPALTAAFTRLGATLGLDWVQATASRLDSSDPWDRLLLAGITRDLQQMRLDFLARADGMQPEAYLEQWLNTHERRVTQFQRLVERARSAAMPTATMLAEIASQARGLLSRN